MRWLTPMLVSSMMLPHGNIKISTLSYCSRESSAHIILKRTLLTWMMSRSSTTLCMPCWVTYPTSLAMSAFIPPIQIAASSDTISSEMRSSPVRWITAVLVSPPSMLTSSMMLRLSAHATSFTMSWWAFSHAPMFFSRLDLRCSTWTAVSLAQRSPSVFLTLMLIILNTWPMNGSTMLSPPLPTGAPSNQSPRSVLTSISRSTP